MRRIGFDKLKNVALNDPVTAKTIFCRFNVFCLIYLT